MKKIEIKIGISKDKYDTLNYNIILLLKDCSYVYTSDTVICRNSLDKKSFNTKFMRSMNNNTILRILVKKVKYSFSKYKGRNFVRDLLLGKNLGNHFIILQIMSLSKIHSYDSWNQPSSLKSYNLELEELDFIDNFWLKEYL